MIRIGLCGKVEDWDLAEKTGFDYLELPVNAIAAMTDDDFLQLAEENDKRTVKIEKCNLLFPKTLSLFLASDEELTSYAEKAFSRMHRLGADIAVFGSGKSRNIPEGTPYAEGMQRLIHATRVVAPVADKYGVTIVMEELNRKESNCLNSLTECALFTAAVNHKSVQMLSDMYHMVTENEPLSDVALVGKLSHAHIALRGTRGYPVADDPDVALFIDQLHTIGYDGALSIEGKSTDKESEAPKALALLKRYCHG